mmetsp:Transcript_27714/g.41236  ORF Transcript_27714/g.41236 Transcript_27714/m.41236 type:complete len:156 (-) Transcript_27714:336-803(-)
MQISNEDAERYYRPKTHPCREISQLLFQCHAMNGKLGEECVREELLYKKCHAQLHCKREAKAFYEDIVRGVPKQKSLSEMSLFASIRNRSGGLNTNNNEDRGNSVVSCSMLVERFAFPENELNIPEGMKVGKECRAIVHDLAKCMSRKSLTVQRD